MHAFPVPVSTAPGTPSFTLSAGFSIACAFFLCPFFLVKTGPCLWWKEAVCSRVQLCVKGALLEGSACLHAHGEQGDALASPPHAEIDVISLPGGPKEMFCPISSPFRPSPIYVRSWGTAMTNHCHCHQRLRLAKSSSCGFPPALTEGYFLDNMFLFGPTFSVFLALLFPPPF